MSFVTKMCISSSNLTITVLLLNITSWVFMMSGCFAPFTVPKLQMKFSIQNMCPIEGEANVARFLFKLLAPYPSDPTLATLVDGWVDMAFFQLAEGSAKERAAVLRNFNSALGRNPWLAGTEFSLADIACYCCVLKSGSASSAPTNVQRWIKSCENLGHFSPAKLLTQ